jgi:ABC-type sugar transport system ATPase subunit
VDWRLSAEHISKRFAGTAALHDVAFHLGPGEIHCLVGENGAGKSTLGKIIMGIHQPDSGLMSIDGVPHAALTPQLAKRMGIAMVAQELNLMPELSVAENIFLFEDQSYRGNFFYRKKRLYRNAREIIKGMELHNFPDVGTKAGDLTVGQQQIVEIVKAISQNKTILILDEPTTAISINEVEHLFRILRDLKAKGMSIILVTHRFDEIFSIGDFVSVLCDGKIVRERIPIAELDKRSLVHLMVGRDIGEFYGRRRYSQPGGEALRVENLCDAGGKFHDISFSVRRGEVLGLAGLVGAGRSEIVETIFGVRRVKTGSIYLNGKPVRSRRVRDVIRRGIVLVPDDRKGKGLFTRLGISYNIAVTQMQLEKKFFNREKRYHRGSEELVGKLNLKYSSLGQPVLSLSGGNQQKVLLSKWLALKHEVIIFDEPTRGIDVGTKVEIYDLIRELAGNGKAVIVVSSEMQEVISLTDRLLVINEGRVAAELKSDETTEHMILNYAIPEKEHAYASQDNGGKTADLP